MKFKSKKGFMAALILMIVFLIIALIAFVQFMPVGTPFIDSVVANEEYSPLTKFLFAAIPIFTLIAIIVGGVLK